MADASPYLHRVTVEFLSDLPLEVKDFDSAEKAQRCIDVAMKNSDVWHIFCQVQRAHSEPFSIVFSIYRDNDTRRWPLRCTLSLAFTALAGQT